MPKSIVGKMLDDIYHYQHPYDVPRPFTDRQRAKMLQDIIAAIIELTGEDYTGRPAREIIAAAEKAVQVETDKILKRRGFI